MVILNKLVVVVVISGRRLSPLERQGSWLYGSHTNTRPWMTRPEVLEILFLSFSLSLNSCLDITLRRVGVCGTTDFVPVSSLEYQDGGRQPATSGLVAHNKGGIWITRFLKVKVYEEHQFWIYRKLIIACVSQAISYNDPDLVTAVSPLP